MLASSNASERSAVSLLIPAPLQAYPACASVWLLELCLVFGVLEFQHSAFGMNLALLTVLRICCFLILNLNLSLNNVSFLLGYLSGAVG